MRIGLAAASFLLIAALLPAQTPPPPAATQTYTNAALHLTFTYPAELRPRAPGADPDGSRSHSVSSGPYRAHPSDDACTRILLSAGTGTGTGPSGPVATLTLFDHDPSCIPPKVLRDKHQMDSLLTGIVQQGILILGFAPIEEPLSYPIQAHRMHFAAAQGQPVVQGALQPADREQMIAVAAVQVNGHIVSWMLQSDDKDWFNRLLASQVGFGAGPPQALFPERFQ